MQKPELIVFSQYLLGGGASFHRNMIANFPRDFFDLKCIYLNPTNWHGAKALDITLEPNDVIFSYGEEPAKVIAKNLSRLISSTEGALVTNLETELISLDIHRKAKKTVFFICHDAGFIPLAVKFQSIIDVFIAHNISVYNELVRLIGKRVKDMHFIQHGVSIPVLTEKKTRSERLRIVFLARHHAFKGIYDLPIINDILLNNGLSVDWMILGDGPERNDLIAKVKNNSNFQFQIPQTPAQVIEILKTQDVFILPSRNDGLPVAMLEAMSVGCVPVIANFSEGIKKVVTDDIGFVLPIGDNAAFAEKIMLLAKNEHVLNTLSQNCIDKTRNEFDIRKQAMEYFNLYKQYKTLKRKHSYGFQDLYRKLSYSESFNKIIHLIGSAKNRIGIGLTKS